MTLDNSQNATFAGDVGLADNKKLKFGAGPDFEIYHNSTTNVNHISSLLSRQLSIDADATTFSGDVNVQDNLYLQDGSTVRAKIQLNASDRDDLDIITASLGSKMKFFTVGAERMRIDDSGNVGIGTTSPTNKLTISDNSAQILLIDTSTSNKGEIEIGDADFTFNLDRDGAISSGKFAWRIDDTTRMELGLDAADLGQLRLNEYGSGNITGTATQLLGVDENGYIIETSTSGGGTVTGSGAATRVAFWSGTSALSSDANLYWDNSNDRLGIGTSAPGAKLDVRGSGGGYLKFDTSSSNGSIKSDFNLQLYADPEDGNTSGLQNIQFFTAGSLTFPLL